MQVQLKQLLTIAPDVYIHDASYLGFPAYRVYVPTVSTSHIPFDDFQLKCYEVMEQFPKMIEDKAFTLENIKKIEKTIFNENTFVNGLIFRSLGESRFHLLHASTCCDMGNFDLAKQYLKLSKSKYSECLIRTIELMEKNTNGNEIEYLIELFFGNKMCEISRKWKDGRAFEGTIMMFEEMGISFSPRLFMKKVNLDATNALHMALKKVMINDYREDAIERIFANIQL